MKKMVPIQVDLSEIVVRANKTNGQKLITIPKNCNIKAGDKVGIFKIVEGDK